MKEIYCIIGAGNAGKSTLVTEIDNFVKVKYPNSSLTVIRSGSKTFVHTYDISKTSRIGISAGGDELKRIVSMLNKLNSCSQIVCVANVGRDGKRVKAVSDFAINNGYDVYWFPVVKSGSVWKKCKMFKHPSYITTATKQIAYDPIVAKL